MYDIPSSPAAARIEPVRAIASSRSALPGPSTIVPSFPTIRMRGRSSYCTHAVYDSSHMRTAAVALTFFLAACAHHGFVSDRLYCGLNIPDGGAVAPSDIDAFIAQEVEPRFPEGFTVWRARGHWKGGSEETLVIEILHPHTPQLDAAVRQIADAYRARFRQEAVLRVTSPAAMRLH
jgi:hypothetical protein